MTTRKVSFDEKENEMKRIKFFIHYLVSLREPVHDTNIWSVSLAWRLSGIAAR